MQTNFTNPLYSCYSHNGVKYIGGYGLIVYGDAITNLNHSENLYDISVRSFTALNDGRVIATGGYFAFNTSVGSVIMKSPNNNSWTVIADSLLSLGGIDEVITLNSDTVIWAISSCINLGPCLGGIRKFDFGSLKEYKIPTIDTTNGIMALAKSNSVIVGVGSKIARSTDNGATWSKQSTPNGVTLLSVAMLSTTIGYACGVDGVLLATYDSGQSWSALQSGTTKNLYRIFFPTSTVGYAVGDEGTIIKIDLAGN